MITLGIETSCDETAAAICKDGNILTNIVSQQIIHKNFGGVVPEIASREHEILLNKVVDTSLKEANIQLNQIDTVAVTQGPGLTGALLTGVSFAKGLGLGLGVPVIPVNHLEGHIFANFLAEPTLEYPFVCLLVSGGHTQLWYIEGIEKYSLLGETRDDAAGEAFDKGARILGLNYPGGPEIERIAKKGDPRHFDLPQPMVKEDNLDFSFSGLKTAVYYLVKKKKKLDMNFKSNIAASFQYAVSETLINKCNKAIEENYLNKLVIGGGVASNAYLKKRFKENIPNVELFYPRQERCTDNGAMVAIAGFYRLSKSKNIDKIDIKPKWSLSEI